MKRLRAVIYARVSSDRQKRDGTIQSQLSTLPAWIKAQGWELVGEYTDDGKSASRNIERRGALAQLRADASKNIYDVVVVVDVDRLTRSEHWTEFGAIIGDFQNNGIRIASPSTGLVTLGDTPGDISVFMRVIIAAQDNKKRVETLMRGKQAAAKRGCLPSGPTPYGLSWTLGARDASGWSIHPERGALALEVYQRAAAGESGHSIARDFEARGITPPNKGRWFLGITRILRSTAYRGEWAWQGIPIKVPAIVSDELWYAAQVALGVSKKKGLSQTKHHYLCDGLATCGVCGKRLWVRARDPKFRYYTCMDSTERRLPGTVKCPLDRMRSDQLDATVWELVAEFLSQPRETILAKLQERQDDHRSEAEAWASDVERLATQLSDLDAADVQIMDMLTRKMISPSAFQTHCATTTQRRQKLQAQLEKAQAIAGEASKVTAATANLSRLVERLQKLVKKASPADQRELVRLLVPKGGVKLNPGREVVVRLVFETEAATPAVERTVTLLRVVAAA